jgi:hypothetical protein
MGLCRSFAHKAQPSETRSIDTRSEMKILMSPIKNEDYHNGDRDARVQLRRSGRVESIVITKIFPYKKQYHPDQGMHRVQ